MKGDLDDVLWLESGTTNRATPMQHSFVMFVCADMFWYVNVWVCSMFIIMI